MVNLQMFSLSPSLNVSIKLINNHLFVYIVKLPNLDPWINQNEEHMVATNTITNKFENHLLSIRDDHQKMIHPNSHPTYNERHQKIIELIDWTQEKYRTANIKENNQQNEEAIIIDNIIEELDKKREVAINKKKEAQLRDEVSIYRLEENTLDYILFIIRELTGKLY
ncbi:MAG TPA: hypothetical protein VIZ62_02230 [Nitrososphaeraceae archaeon]